MKIWGKDALRFTTSVNRASVVEYDDRLVVKVHDQSLVLNGDTREQDAKDLRDLRTAIDHTLERWEA